MNYNILNIVCAYFLDLILGDPQVTWHPVRFIGRLIEYLENRLNTDRFNRRLLGVVLIVVVIGLTVFCVWGALNLAKFIHPLFYYIISILFIYFSLSIKDLAVEVNKVYKALESKNIQEARNSLSMIVGRDTEKLDEPQIIRATVETVAESAMDGIIAPLFYTFLGGPVLVWAYKAINTLDSMVGYRNERFIEFGKVSAKLDRLANFIPAKLTCFLISVSSFCCGKDWLNSLKWGLKYLFQGTKINSEATEAAMAGGLRIQLGGTNFYNSVPIYKPFIGDAFQSLGIKHIRESIRIVYISSALMLILGVVIYMII